MCVELFGVVVQFWDLYIFSTPGISERGVGVYTACIASHVAV